MNDYGRRLARLEAAEHVRSALAEYSMAVDGRRFNDVVELFAEDAVFVGVNFPSGSRYQRAGRAEIASVARMLAPTEIRHHVTNVSIDVSDDATHATSTAYYLHTYEGGISGGMYEGTWRREPANSGRALPEGAGVEPDVEQPITHHAWRIVQWQVTAGWSLPISGGYAYAHSIVDRTIGGGRPSRWRDLGVLE